MVLPDISGDYEGARFKVSKENRIEIAQNHLLWVKSCTMAKCMAGPIFTEVVDPTLKWLVCSIQQI